MSDDSAERPEGDLNRQVREAWETIAPFWDDYVGAEGNDSHRRLIAPVQLRLLAIQPGETVLDIACGNGQFARELARLGANVVACDYAASFVERARRHTAEAGITTIEYHVLDAADEPALLALGPGRFDAAVCTMAMMDMVAIEPMLAALRGLLRPGGRFVFSVTHPAFNHNAARMMVETADRDGELVSEFALKVAGYLDIPPQRGLGIIGQPVPHWLFHRSLSALLGACFAAGLVVDGLEEPAFTSADAHPDRHAS